MPGPRPGGQFLLQGSRLKQATQAHLHRSENRELRSQRAPPTTPVTVKTDPPSRKCNRKVLAAFFRCLNGSTAVPGASTTKYVWRTSLSVCAKAGRFLHGLQGAFKARFASARSTTACRRAITKQPQHRNARRAPAGWASRYKALNSYAPLTFGSCSATRYCLRTESAKVWAATLSHHD